ncbi:MAG: hypothetical protein JNJ49_12460 [Bdellovibrionaceae bacterium]|nr:hypothetical protein [Pseudobdellovibrionaceae bacterium]
MNKILILICLFPLIASAKAQKVMMSFNHDEVRTLANKEQRICYYNFDINLGGMAQAKPVSFYSRYKSLEDEPTLRTDLFVMDLNDKNEFVLHANGEQRFPVTEKCPSKIEGFLIR